MDYANESAIREEGVCTLPLMDCNKIRIFHIYYPFQNIFPIKIPFQSNDLPSANNQKILGIRNLRRIVSKSNRIPSQKFINRSCSSN